MKYRVIIFIIILFIPLKIFAFDNGNIFFVGSNDRWVGYVIKLTDYALYKGSERKNKMIFPRSKAYISKDQCYVEFEKVFSESDMVEKYPQTNNPYESYIFGCIKN